MPGDGLALRADLVDLGQDLGQGNQAAHRAGGPGRRGLLPPVRQILDPVHDADRQRLAAHRAAPPVLPGLAGREADVAMAVPVQVVLALLGKEFQRAPVPLARLQRPAQGEVVQLGVEDAHLPSELFRGVGVGVGHEPETVQGRHPPVHRRVRGEARLHREDVGAQVPVAVVDGVEARLRAQRGEPGRPDMGGNEIGAGVRFQGDLQQVPGIEAQDRASVRVQVADPRQAVHHPLRRVEAGGVDQVVDLARLVELLVDGRDLDREHEPHRAPAAPAGRRKPLLDGPLQIRPQAEQPRLRGHELFLQLGPPRRMGEVAGGDDADALLARPDGQMLEIAVPAGRAGVLGVDVQIGVEGHVPGFRLLDLGRAVRGVHPPAGPGVKHPP